MSIATSALDTEQTENRLLDVLEGHRNSFIRYFYYKTSNVDDAEDLMQELSLKAWRAISRHPGMPENEMLMWLKRIAHHLAVSAYRSRAHRGGYIEPLPDGYHLEGEAAIDPDDIWDDPAERPVVFRALDRMSDPEMRAVVVEHVLQDRGFDEIASRRQTEPRVVRQVHYRGMAHLNKVVRIHKQFVDVPEYRPALANAS